MLCFRRGILFASCLALCGSLPGAWAGTATPVVFSASAAAPPRVLADEARQGSSIELRHSFGEQPQAPAHPLGGLTAGRGGAWFGATSAGGAHAMGSIYRLDPDGTLSVLHSFAGGADGATPTSRPVVGADGALYGTTSAGGQAGQCGLGTLWRLGSQGDYQVLHAFGRKDGDGAAPRSQPLTASDRHLYGVTPRGGRFGAGVLYRVNPGGEVEILHDFGADGDVARPIGAPVQTRDGALYGTAEAGGSRGRGGIWRWSPEHGELVVGSAVADDAPRPLRHSLVEGDQGRLFGVSERGGDHDGGTLFELTPRGVLRVVHSFGAPGGGQSPSGDLTRGDDGAFYGTTARGGAFGGGTLYRFQPDGSLQELAFFAAGRTDPHQPRGRLMQAGDSRWWGITSLGGSAGLGSIFSVTPPRPSGLPGSVLP